MSTTPVPVPVAEQTSTRPARVGAGARGAAGRVRDGLECLLAALLPLAATLALYLPSGLAAPVRLLTGALLLLALARVVVRPRRLLTGPVLVVGIAGAMLLTLGLVGRLRYPSMTSWADYAHLLLVVVACSAFAVLGRRRAVVVALVAGWGIAGMVAAGVGVWEVVTARHLPRNGPARHYAGKMPGWNQISSFFDNPNLYAYQLAVLVQLALLVACWVRGWPRMLVAAYVVLMLHQLWWTSGRTGLIVLALTAALLMLRSWWGRGLLVVGVVGFLVALWARWGPALALWTQLYRIWDGRQWPGKSTWVRLQLLRSGWVMARESDWLGVGPGGFTARALLPSNPYRAQWRHGRFSNAHFGMTEVLAQYGLVGLVVLLVALALGIVALVRTSRRSAHLARWSPERTAPLVVAVMLSTLPVLTLANATWLRQPLTAVHLGTLVALVAALVPASRARRTDPRRPSPDTVAS